jgi:L-arabinonolactonase
MDQAYTPDVRLKGVIEMPVKKVTSVNFTGANLDFLLVTAMTKSAWPHAL